MKIASIVVAAGSGSRFGGAVPKQFHLLGEQTILEWSLEVAAESTDFVVLVIAPEFREHVLGMPAAGGYADAVVDGGSTRSASVRNGLACVPDCCEVIVVHDAARPLASRELFRSVIRKVVNGADAAIPGIAVTDTIKRVATVVEGTGISGASDADGPVGSVLAVETVRRTELIAVQTPQAFRADVLRRAHQDPADASDDAALVESIGGKVVVVPGETENLKVTNVHDLATVASLVALSSAAGPVGSQ